MALNTSGLQVAAAALAGAITKLRLHTADPAPSSGTGALTTAADRSVIPTATGGVVTVTQSPFTGGAPSGPVTHVSAWAGSTFVGSAAVGGDQAFNAQGNFMLAALTITGG